MIDDKEIRVRNTPPFKLKDKKGRNYQGINLKNQFGFLPEVIIIEKLPGYHDTVFVRAVLTDEELKSEESMRIKKPGEVASK